MKPALLVSVMAFASLSGCFQYPTVTRALYPVASTQCDLAKYYTLEGQPMSAITNQSFGTLSRIISYKGPEPEITQENPDRLTVLIDDSTGLVSRVMCA